jgi:hypothetical protein
MLTALSLWHRLSNYGCTGCKPAPRKAESLAGLAGLLAAIAAFLAIHSTYPASIYDAAARGYFVLLFLISVPVAALLVVVSLFLLLRRHHHAFGADCDVTSSSDESKRSMSTGLTRCMAKPALRLCSTSCSWP